MTFLNQSSVQSCCIGQDSLPVNSLFGVSRSLQKAGQTVLARIRVAALSGRGLEDPLDAAKAGAGPRSVAFTCSVHTYFSIEGRMRDMRIIYQMIGHVELPVYVSLFPGQPLWQVALEGNRVSLSLLENWDMELIICFSFFPRSILVPRCQ
jgi:hypothetical protein